MAQEADCFVCDPTRPTISTGIYLTRLLRACKGHAVEIFACSVTVFPVVVFGSAIPYHEPTVRGLVQMLNSFPDWVG